MDIGILQIKTSWIDVLNFYVQAKNSDWRTVFLFMCRHYWLHSQHLIDYLLKKKSASKKTIRLCREFDFRVVFVVWGSVCAFHYLCAAHSTHVNLIDLARWICCASLLKSMLRLRQSDLFDPIFDRNKHRCKCKNVPTEWLRFFYYVVGTGYQPRISNRLGPYILLLKMGLTSTTS